MTADTISDAELSAFIDGELPSERMAAVEARLAADPALSERIEAYRGDMARLAHAYDPVLSWPMPDPASAPRPRARPIGVWRMAAPALAAAAAVLVVIASALHLGSPPDDPLVVNAMAARAGSLAPVDTLDEPGLAVAANAEMEARFGLKAQAPDLAKAGWRLVRAATYAPPEGRFIELRYRNDAGQIFTIALEPRGGEPDHPFDLTRRGDLAVCVWKTDELEAVMLGQMKLTDMAKLASRTYDPLRI